MRTWNWLYELKIGSLFSAKESKGWHMFVYCLAFSVFIDFSAFALMFCTLNFKCSDNTSEDFHHFFFIIAKQIKQLSILNLNICLKVLLTSITLQVYSKKWKIFFYHTTISLKFCHFFHWTNWYEEWHWSTETFVLLPSP